MFAELGGDVAFTALAEDGAQVEFVPQALARLEGSARTILTGERLALNLLGRLCGIATLTHAFVEAVAGTGVDLEPLCLGCNGITAGGVCRIADQLRALRCRPNRARRAGGQSGRTDSAQRA